MTGWAQVNGWRGNTSLEERIRFDIWYVENWSVGLDFRIMFLTFLRAEKRLLNWDSMSSDRFTRLLYRTSDGMTECLIYFAILFGPWAFGTTQPGQSRS